VFKRFENWSYTDREIVEHHIDRLDVQTFYLPHTKGYVGCLNADERRVMYLAPGYVQFAHSDFAPAGLWMDPDWQYPGFALSTFRDKDSPTTSRESEPVVCPTCNTALPLTGICDECLDET
jgi:hypothetical protein